MSDIYYVTAFYDIGRGNWNTFRRSPEHYINSFKNYLNVDYHMIIFIDSRIKIPSDSFKNKTFIPIDEKFLETNIKAWQNKSKDVSIMNSEKYKELIGSRNNPENHFPEYNCINHSKLDFIKYAYENNYIKSNFVCWTDFGYHYSFNSYPKQQVDINKLNQQKINIGTYEPLRGNLDPYYILANAPNIFCGCFLGIPIPLLTEFYNLYHDCLDELYNLGISDDDQHVYLRCYLKYPNLFEVYPFNKCLEKLQKSEIEINKLNLTTLMNKYGSDKGTFHNYTIFYETIFKNKIVENLFELGLGTNNTDVLSNMGPNGKPGASLYGWRDYFPDSQIYGADIDKRILFQSDRIKTFYCDQTDPQVIKDMWEMIPEQFDIIIEDGLHEFDAHVCFFENSINKLNKNGIYVIEDVHVRYIDNVKDILDLWKIQFPSFSFELVILDHPRNKLDNILVVIRNNG